MAASKAYTIFVGNPGTGKSTLLNGLVGEVKFECGMSFGGGLTSVLQLHQTKDGSVYGDTPGLSDVVLRKQAAKEIQDALSKDGDYRLIFCITLEAGRVRPDDTTTVKLILESVKAEVPFGILINKLAEDEHTALLTQPENQKKVVAAILAGSQRSTVYFYGIKTLASLHGKNNTMAPDDVTKDLRGWLDNIPLVKVRKEQVVAINSETFEEIQQKAAAQLKEMEENQAKMEAEFKAAMERAEKERLRREEELKSLREDVKEAKNQAASDRARMESQMSQLQDDLRKANQAAMEAAKAPRVERIIERSSGGGFCVIS